MSTPESLHENNPDKKTKYFSTFALKNLSEMRILKEGGVLGKENQDWRNISEHCLVEAVAADVLAEALAANRDKVIQAALLHDWFKRKEIEYMKAEGGAEGSKIAHVEDENKLRELGIDEEMISLAHSNVPESADPEYIATRSVEQKIVHLVDMIASGSNIISYEDRMIPVRQKPYNIEFSDSFKETYKGRSLFDIQEELTHAEIDEFEKTIGLEQGTLIEFIKSKIQQRIDATE